MNTKIHSQPDNPIHAVTHPDPYPYYRDLVQQRPLYFDETLKLWVAASAEAVNAVLSSPILRVRPTAEPVPKAILNSPAADIFRHLVRMIDGAAHRSSKQAVSAVLGQVDPAHLTQLSKHWAKMMFDKFGSDPTSLTQFAFQLPAYVMSDLLGIPHDYLNRATDWIGDFVRCLSPLSTPAQIEQGKIASTQLLGLTEGLLTTQRSENTSGLVSKLTEEFRQTEHYDPELISANAIGFLSQAYEATAGLIGNSVVTLARRPDILKQVKNDSGVLSGIIHEVLRFDSPVQNTRRYLAEDGVIAGYNLKAGEAILMVLAAANHDPAVNPSPERFDIHRKDRRMFSFGVGVHACPGQALAAGIAQAGVAQWISAGIDFTQLADGITYQDSVNVRIPLFVNPIRIAAQ